MAKRFFSAAFFCVATLVCVFCVESESVFKKELQREFVIIDSAHRYNLNPFTATYTNDARVLIGLYEGLFSYNPLTLEPEPAIAESFKISRNKLTWTITLKENITFSNGEKITAYTFQNAWRRLLDPSLNAPFASLLDCIKGAEEYRTGKNTSFSSVGISAKDDRTLVIKLNGPTEHLAKLLCHHSFSAFLPDEPEAYSGAFVLEEMTQDNILLKRNAKYRAKDTVPLSSIRFILSDDREKNTYMFNTGKADWVTGPVDSNSVLDSSSLSVSPQFGTEYLFFKTGNGIFSDPDVRNALIYAAPVEELRAGSLIQSNSLVLPLSGYPEVFGLPDPDEETALALLKKAGYGESEKLKVKLCLIDSEYSHSQAEILQKAWEKIGVETLCSFLPSEQYMDAIEKEDADIFSYIWIGDFADPLAFLELFRGSSTLNVSDWVNPGFDALLNEAATIKDSSKRYEKLAEAEQILIDDGVIIPISHTVSLNLVDFSTVKGWFSNALDIHPLRYLYFVLPEPYPNLVMAK